MRKTEQSSDMTSFHGHTVAATVQQLIRACGEPVAISRDPSNKSQYDWILETESGKVFTIYDWKEYRSFEEDELIHWHVGSHESKTAEQALSEIKEMLYQDY